MYGNGIWFLIGTKPHPIRPFMHLVYWGVRYPKAGDPKRALCNVYEMPKGVTRVDDYRSKKIMEYAIHLSNPKVKIGEWKERV